MKKLRLFLPFIVFAVLAAFLLRGLYLDPREMPSALLDRPFPAFKLPALEDGERQITEEALQGRVTLVNVWGTWCPPCREEHPYLVELAEEKGVRILGMNYKDDPEDARQWLRELGDPYVDTFMDRDGRFGIDLGVFGAPETYLVDAEGVIRYKHVGVVNDQVWDEMGTIYRKLRQQADRQ